MRLDSAATAARARTAGGASIVGWASLPVGVVTLAERYGGTVGDRATSTTRWSMRSPRCVQKFAVAHRGDPRDGFHMLGTSGTVTTIAGVFLRPHAL